MELDDDSTKLVHREEGEGGRGYWVIGLVVALYILSIALYTPAMP